MGVPLGTAFSFYSIPWYVFARPPLDMRSPFLAAGQQPYPGYEILCRVEANLRGPYQAAQVRTGTGGLKYREVDVSIQYSLWNLEH
jgi:hypothetical protein